MEQPVRKRRRPAVACTECRRRKVKCDRTLPCASCVLGTLPCAYNSPNVPTQNLRSSTDAGFHWSSMPNIVVTDINLQRFYGNSIENLETPTLPPSDTDHHGLDGPSVARYRATILGTSVEGVDAVSESSDVSNMSPPRTSVQDAPTSIKSSMSRGTHLTPNHWKDVFKESVQSNRAATSLDSDPLLSPLLDRCKRLSDQVRVQRATQRRVPPSLINVTLDMPSRAICDELIQLYFRTFDTVFRILHVPTFEKDYQAYWSDQLASKETFHQKLLLVMAIGTCFYYDDEKQECPLRTLASRWIFQVQYWLVNVFETGEPNMDVIQVSALLLLARQVDRVGTNLIWISADFPLRIAISEGYHKEPSIHFPDIQPFEAEMRRRLWATILELSLQSSLDAGMPPPISCDGFDCHPPANIDDIELDASMEPHTTTKTLEQFTQSTIQIMLVHTIRLRLRILRSITTFENPLSYQDTLKLGLEVEVMCRSHLPLIQTRLSMSCPADTEPMRFQIKLLDTLTRRFILALHGPFANLAKQDLWYYYSKKVVTESAYQILAYPLPPFQHLPTHMGSDHYNRLQIFGGGIFKHTAWHALASLITELFDDVDQSPLICSSLSSEAHLLDIIQRHVAVLRRQKQAGDLDTEAFVLFTCVAAQVSARIRGNPLAELVTQTVRSSLEFCCSVLEAELGAHSLGDSVEVL